MTERKKFFYIILFLLWLGITFVTGVLHEPWADEAQSWLISRDNTYFDMITKYLKYEGHPALFYFLLRFLHQLQLPYNFLFLVPMCATGIGVYLLLFKTKLPDLIKCIFPFTYYIIYQYGVIARSYSLVLPVLMLIAIIYKNRIQKILLYSGLLILLLSICAYSYITAFILFSFLIYDIIKAKNINFKTIGSIILVLLFFIITAIYIKTPADCTSWEPFTFSVKNFCSVFANSFFNANKINIFHLIIPACLYISAAFTFCKNIRQTLFFTFINAGILLSLTFTVCRCWHYGLVFITLIFTLTVLNSENELNKTSDLLKKLFCTLFTLLSVIQIYWSTKAINSDLINDYSCSLEIYKFIVNNNLNNYDMNGLGYQSVILKPYFKDEIYKNFKTSQFQFSTGFYEYSDNEILKFAPVMIYDYSWEKRYRNIKDKLENDYYAFPFYSYFCCKGKIYEQADLYVLIKKDLINQLKYVPKHVIKNN